MEKIKDIGWGNDSDNSIISALVEIFEQISTYNEICYQTIQVALLSALEMLKNKENREALSKAIEQLRSTLDRCRNASDKIKNLSHSGCMITSKITVNQD